MKIEKTLLKKIKENPDNPRIMTEEKNLSLLRSILLFPKMLEARPIVVNAKMEALGGNMRRNALEQISKMSANDITNTLNGVAEWDAMVEGQKSLVISYWLEWQQKPEVPYLKASDFTEEEQRKVVIEDNVSFGSWDFSRLANEWDEVSLKDWGVDVWQPNDAFNEDSDDAGADDTPAGEESVGNYSITYEIAFNNEGEQDRWFAFINAIRRIYPEEGTIAERILRVTDKFVEEHK